MRQLSISKSRPRNNGGFVRAEVELRSSDDMPAFLAHLAKLLLEEDTKNPKATSAEAAENIAAELEAEWPLRPYEVESEHQLIHVRLVGNR